MPALVRLWPVAALAVAAAACAEAWGDRALRRLVRRDVEALLAQSSAGRPAVVTGEMLSDLPEPVRRYLARTGVVGQPIPSLVRLRQQGRMRLDRGQPWIPVTAEQHYCVDPPGFVWAGTMRLGPVRLARARDMYLGGHGRMLVRLASLLPVRGRAVWQLPDGDLDYIDVTVTDLQYA